MILFKYLFAALFLVKRLVNYSKLASESRIIAYKFAGAKIGNGVVIRTNVSIINCRGVTIEDGCYIGENTTISASDSEVLIGRNTLIAPNCFLVARNHIVRGLHPIKFSGFESKAIYIGNDCWIGADSKILSGVTINHNSVVAAGSVVNKNVEKNSIVGGIPAKLIKFRSENV